jgi:hypothetical protein
MNRSPILSGFRLIFRRPAIVLAEIIWRWSFAAAVWFLVIAFAFEYLDSLPVNAVSRFLLGTGQPILIARALRRIFEGSALRFTQTGVLLALAVAVAWIVLGSLGRAATVNSIAHELGIECSPKRSVFPSLALTHFLRLSATLASIVGIAGSALIASSVWASSHISIADAGRILGLFCFLSCVLWVVMNRLLSTSAIFAVLDGDGALGALGSLISLIVSKTGAVISVSALFGAAHLATFIVGSVAAVFAFGLANSIPHATVVALVIFIVCAYCAVADFLYIGRIAAYISILRADDLPALAELSAPPYGADGSVDKAELILSDAPAPAM